MKYSKQEDKIIIDGIKQKLSYSEIADEVSKLGKKRSSESVRNRYKLLRKKNKELEPAVKNVQNTDIKTGMEIKNDYVVVNWTTKTVITELGEFGPYVCSLNMHGAIMRAYSDEYEGKGMTQAEIAMRYDFPHAKAVAKYMKAHGMTKSMVGQTDLEIEDGLTVEEAVEENIQAVKRAIHKKTERKKWSQIQKYADNWLNLHHGTLKPFENHIEEFLPKHKIKPIKLSQRHKRGKKVALVGISDVHYMKQCYDAFGNSIYDRKIAKERLFSHAKKIIDKYCSGGIVPEKFILPIGADNLHIDNIMQTTTRGTPQANSTDGSYRIELGPYLDMTMALVETFAQVAPTDVVLTPGNHDLHTSYLLGEFIKRLYEKDKRVEVIVRYHERVYIQYGTNCFILSHGDKISLARTKREVHKLIMSEARQQGIKPNDIQEWIFAQQHLHKEEQIDLGGMVEFIIFPSMSEADDWHSDSGYVGSKKNSMLVVYDYKSGKDTVVYAGRE